MSSPQRRCAPEAGSAASATRPVEASSEAERGAPDATAAGPAATASSTVSDALVKGRRKGWYERLMNDGGNLLVVLFLCYAAFSAHSFYRVCFPDHSALEGITLGRNSIAPGARVDVQVFRDRTGLEDSALESLCEGSMTYDLESEPFRCELQIALEKEAVAEYNDEQFDTAAFRSAATLRRLPIAYRKSLDFAAVRVVASADGEKLGAARGSVLRTSKPPAYTPTYRLLTGEECPAVREDVREDGTTNRGVPEIAVKLVHMTSESPVREEGGTYLPPVEYHPFWLGQQDLLRLPGPEDDGLAMKQARQLAIDQAAGGFSFLKFIYDGLADASQELQQVQVAHNATHYLVDTRISLSLASEPAHRFQSMMKHGVQANMRLFGENSLEVQQMKDVFANTNPTLMTVTLCVSVLHIIFEFLAFRSDLEFWRAHKVETLAAFTSVRSVFIGIFCQMLLVLYLYDEQANLLVIITSCGAILVDSWKLKKAMKPALVYVRGGRLAVGARDRTDGEEGTDSSGKEKHGEAAPLVPRRQVNNGIPVGVWLVSRFKVSRSKDYDKQAIVMLSKILVPLCLGYALYSLNTHCYKTYKSYALSVVASLVYALGFALMCPQLFINHKHKSVQHLPWRKFVYRALNTFVDDLFSMIVRMPTMHRISCFRDDVVFVGYLAQRWMYPVDKKRLLDDDDVNIDELDGAGEGGEEKRRASGRAAE